MADTKISALTEATTITGAHFDGIQGGTNKRFPSTLVFPAVDPLAAATTLTGAQIAGEQSGVNKKFPAALFASVVVTGSSGDWWGGKVLEVSAAGVAEAGRYLDFHSTDTDVTDYTYRMDNTSNGVMSFSGSLLLGTPLAVTQGGTGAATLSANAVLLGNGASSPQTVAPGTSGNVLTSNGTTWTSAASAADGQPIPTTSIFGVGTLLFCLYNSTTVVANGGTAAGSLLHAARASIAGALAGDSAQTGTWKNVSGVDQDSDGTSKYGYWVRTA